MTVQLIAWTHFQPPLDVPWQPMTGGPDIPAGTAMLPVVGQQDWHGPSTPATGGQDLVEFAGRACYQSWDRPNPDTATNAGYLAHILRSGHFSVLEHGTATFYLTGVTRSFTHELIRHRHLSYSQLSQRYVAADGSVVEPEVIAADPYLHRLFTDAVATANSAYRELAHALERKHNDALWVVCADPGTCIRGEHIPDPIGSGMRHRISDDHPRVKRLKTAALKKARQAARAVLPNATETRIVVTGNYRAWRHFVDMRATEHADVEIREVALEILAHLKVAAPSVFADYEMVALGDGTIVARTEYAERS